MDQGAAAVLAAGVAGFSSAAGAAIGAVLAARSVRSTTVLTVEESRASRYEDGRKQSYSTFRTKVAAVFDALTDLVADLRSDRPASREPVQRAVDDVRKSLVNDVVPCLVQEVNVAADGVYVRLAEALTAASELLTSPHDAKDANSPSMTHLENRIEEAYVALKLFSHLSGEAIYGR